MKDGSIRQGWASSGYMHGPVRGSCLNGNLSFLGHYKGGLPSGYAWQSLRGGGWLVGQVCPFTGQFTGDPIAFLYPDLKTAVVGEFQNGVLLHGTPSVISSLGF